MGIGIKILTPSKLLTRRPLLLAQIRAGLWWVSYSDKLKTKSNKYYIFSINTIETPKHYTTI